VRPVRLAGTDRCARRQKRTRLIADVARENQIAADKFRFDAGILHSF
jgi:hypothetical protein